MSIMYKYTRQEAAVKLNISTRSIDRYIKSWKLRSKKEGKVVYVKWSDVENMLWGWAVKQEVIIENKNSNNDQNISNTKTVSTWKENIGLDNIYSDLRTEIKEKDMIIRELSIRVWRSEEVAKNSVTLMDFKKSQYLLEESKTHLSGEVEELKEDKEKLEKDLKYEKNTNILLIIFVFLLLVISWAIWFLEI